MEPSDPSVRLETESVLVNLSSLDRVVGIVLKDTSGFLLVILATVMEGELFPLLETSVTSKMDSVFVLMASQEDSVISVRLDTTIIPLACLVHVM